MSDVFISYASSDEKLAKFLYRHLSKEGLDVFMASVSVQLGEKWSLEILNNLRLSSWILFLASKDACSSPYVQQELGAALEAL